MKKTGYILILLTILFSGGCNSYNYIYDNSSRERQHELQNKRAGNACGDVFLVFGSILFEATTGVYVGYMPEGQNFRRIKLVNPTSDTLYVNMLTDLYWDNENYCDFMDIRIPPGEKCRLLLPIDANYNIYFGATENPEEDKLLEFNTSLVRKVKLIPMTLNDSIFIDKIPELPGLNNQ